MTWILGVNAPRWAPRTALLVGDTRASWPAARRHLDRLRKIHLVGSHTAVGFAGSVELGFAAVEKLGSLSADTAALEREMVTRAPRLLRAVWNAASSSNRGHGLDVIVTHASQDQSRSDFSCTTVCKFSASKGFAPEFAKPGASLAIGSGALPFAGALEMYPDLQQEPESTSKALDRFGGWLRLVLTQNNIVTTVAQSAFAIALAQGGTVGPRLYAFDPSLTNTLNIETPLDALAMNFTISGDGSFDFSIERSGGRIETAVALVARQNEGTIIARSAEFKLGDYADSFSALLRLATSSGIGLTLAEASDASAKGRSGRESEALG